MSQAHLAGDPSREELHSLLAECIALAEREGEAGVEAFLARHPARADALRLRIDALRASGLFFPPPGDLGEGEGRLLGDFRLLRKLGEGGMGVVYLAEQRSLGRRVALKLVRPGQLLFEGARERFRREVEAVARLQHPGVVPVHLVGEADGLPYFAMEHIAGCTLADLLRDLAGREPRQLQGRDLGEAIARRASDGASGSPHAASGFAFEGSWTEACLRIVEQAADALDHAHRRGVLHRDVKPSNLMITPAGRVMLLDFGLAATDGGNRLTRSGAQIGSLPYLAPEQVRGDAATLDGRTDVYGLGVTLYECLTLRLPYQAESAAATMQLIEEGRPRGVRGWNPNVPFDAETLCLTAMHRDRAKRYATAADLARDARNVLERRPIEARRPSAAYRARRWVQRHRAATAALLLAAVLAIGGPLGYAVTEHGQRVALEASFRRSEGLRLTAVAERTLATDPTLALLLAIEAAERHPGVESASALLAALHACRELRSIDAHPGGVHRVAFSPDGSWLATAGVDLEVRLWDGDAGTERGRRRGHTRAIASLEFSPDGRRILTSSDDLTARVWSVDAEEPLAVLRGHRRRVVVARFDPGGGRIVSASADGDARLFDAASGALLRVFPGRGAPLVDARFDPSGRRLATASADGVAQLWDPNMGEPLARVAHGDAIVSLGFDAEGTRLLTAGRDGEVRIWGVESGDPLLHLPGNGERIVAAEFDPSGERVLSVALDLRALLWDSRSGALRRERRDHGREIRGATWSRDGRQILTWATDRTVKVLRGDLERTIATLPCGSQVVPSVAIRPDGAVLATAGDRLRLFRAASPLELASAGLFGVRGVQVTSSSDGARIALAGRDGIARVWNEATGAVERTLVNPSRPIYRVALSEDSRWIAVCGGDGTTRVWSAAGGEPAAVLAGHRGIVRWACFTPDASRLVTCGDDRSVRVWDWRAGACLSLLAGAKERVSRLDVSPDGTRVVAAGADSVARVYDLGTGALAAELRGHTGRVTSVRFAAGGRRIVTGSYDNSVRVWEAATGTPVLILPNLDDVVIDANLSPDGARLATSTGDTTVRLWNAATGALLARDTGYSDLVGSVTFAREGDAVIAVSLDGAVRRIPIDPLAQARRRAPRPLTIDERLEHEVGKPAELAILRAAQRAFDEVHQEAMGSVAMRERLRADPTLSEPVRAQALARVDERSETPRLLFTALWARLRAPDRSREEYERAVAPAEALNREVPGVAEYERCLGLAYLRAERYADAVQWLSRPAAASAEEPIEDQAANRALLALALHGAGRSQDSSAERARLEALLAANPDADGPVVRAALASLGAEPK